MSQSRGVNHARPNIFGKRLKGLWIVAIKIDIKDGFGTGRLAFGQIVGQSGAWRAKVQNPRSNDHQEKKTE